MREELTLLCNDFIYNRNVIKKAFKMDSPYLYPVCASVFVDHRKQATEKKLKECRDILKENTGVFSNFRSLAKMVMVTMLAVSDDPESKMKRTLDAYKALKHHFFSNGYLPIAAMIITDYVNPGHYESLAKRTRDIYDLMKKEHPFLTNGEDRVYAVMLALSEHTDQQLIEDAEACYQKIKGRCFSKNAVQALSHTLALADGAPDEKCEKTMQLFRDLQEKGRRYGTDYELATLGVLSMLPGNMEQIEEDILEVDAFLSTQKGYGVLGIGKKIRLMHAGMIVTSAYMDHNTIMSGAAASGTIALLVAQQVAMCAAMASCTAAASSSASSCS